MPCNTVRSVSVAWTEATDMHLVRVALEKLGARRVVLSERAVTFIDNRGQSGTLANGRLDVAAGFDIDALKQQYACEVIEDRFAAQGWDVQETTAVTPAWQRS